MFTIILFVLSSVALSTSQLNVGPQTFPEQSSLSSDKRYVNSQPFKYIISPIQFKNAQNIRSDKKQFEQQHFDTQALLPFIKFPSSEELQNREPLQAPIYNQEEKLITKNLKGLTFFNSHAEQKPRNQYKLVNIQDVKQLQKEFSPISQYSNKDQIESNLLQQIRQQLSRIVDNNPINLRGLSIVPEENQYSKALKAEQSTRPKTNNQEEDQGEATRKEIKDILRGQGNFESLKQNTDVTVEPNYQKSPYFIHRLVAVTKHHPVNIVKKVEVPVPAPILVPVPEPYEVKVPHPYHVPVEVIRHIPVPGRAY